MGRDDSQPGQRLKRESLAALRQGSSVPGLPNHKTGKIHRMVAHLRKHPNGIDAQSLADQLGVHPRTLRRYAAELPALGFALRREEISGGSVRYRLEEADDALPRKLAHDLELLRKSLLAGGNPKWSRLLNRAIRQLQEPGQGENEGEASDIYYVDHGPLAEKEPPSGILNLLEGAILRQEKVRLHYAAARERELTFFPYRLCLRVGVLYLVGREEKNQGPFKSLQVRRIRRCQSLRETFIPDTFDPEAYYRHCFGAFAQEGKESPEKIVLWIREPWAEQLLRGANFNPPAVFTRREGKACFEAFLLMKPDLENWILSLAPAALPLEPESLRDRIATRLASAGVALAKS
jgi:predicted DNA-binding transcriptional regulator YafY